MYEELTSRGAQARAGHSVIFNCRGVLMYGWPI
jgi:hypothetical protein